MIKEQISQRTLYPLRNITIKQNAPEDPISSGASQQINNHSDPEPPLYNIYNKKRIKKLQRIKNNFPLSKEPRNPRLFLFPFKGDGPFGNFAYSGTVLKYL